MSDFIIIPSTLSTVLSAVNVLVTSLGESPVSTIDPSPSSEVDQALVALNNADLQCQLKGWKWNMEVGFPLTKDTDGKVPLPDQTLMVKQAYYRPSSACDVVQRGLFLYDRENHTYVFETAPFVDCTVRLPWEYLPEAARQYITANACMVFQSSLQDRAPRYRVGANMVSEMLTMLEQHEDSIAGHNAISGNLGVQAGLHGNGSLRRNRRGQS